MNKLITLFAIAFVAGFYMTATSDGAAYIKFHGVDGEALDKDHRGWSDLASFSQAMHKPGGGATGQSRRRGDVVLDDLICVKELDKASPKIIEAICKGRVFPKVEIHLTRSSQSSGEESTYYAVEMKNVQVRNHMVEGDAEQGDLEEFSLNFEEIKVTYTEQIVGDDLPPGRDTVDHTAECKPRSGR